MQKFEYQIWTTFFAMFCLTGLFLHQDIVAFAYFFSIGLIGMFMLLLNLVCEEDESQSKN